MREVESTLSFDSQKQLMDCSATSCMAEVAGTLGVDHMLVGSLGKVGAYWLFNVTIVDVKSAAARATVSRRIPGSSETALVDAVDSVLLELEAPFGQTAHGSSETGAKDAAPRVPSEAADAAPTAAARPLAPRLLAGSATVVAGAFMAAALLGAVGGVAAAVGTWVAFRTVNGLDLLQPQLQVGVWLALVTTGVALVGALLGAVATAASLGVAVWLVARS
jgi:hypothetical protein